MQPRAALPIFLCISVCLLTLAPVTASEIVQLTDDSSLNYLPQWSPDGEKLVYISSPSWHQVEIWTINSDGSNKQKITSGMSGFGKGNPWSSDGTKLFYTSTDYWLLHRSWMYDVGTSEKTKVKCLKNIKSAEWVHNGSKLFIVEEEDETQKLWLVESDGKNKTFLSELSGENIGFLLQPSGNRILYTSNESGNYDIWVMNSDGSGKKQLTFTRENENEMAWSQDGNRIVYVSKSFIDKSDYSTYGSSLFNYSQTIWVMDVDGGNKRQLTEADGNRDSLPQWSPNGTKIAFHRMDRGSAANIIIMNSDGSNLTILTGNETSDVSPQWSPKGDKIAFTSSKDGNMSVSVIILDDEWKSAHAETKVSIASSQGNGKKSPGFTISLVMIAFLIALALQKK